MKLVTYKPALRPTFGTVSAVIFDGRQCLVPQLTHRPTLSAVKNVDLQRITVLAVDVGSCIAG